MTQPPTWCSAATVARELDCSIDTVRDYTNRGLLPQPVKKGSMVRWRWSDIEASMAPESEQTGADAAHHDPILRAIHGG